VIRAAALRFAGLLLVISLGTFLLSVAIGLGNGSSASRSASVGFYVVGSLLAALRLLRREPGTRTTAGH